MWIVVFILTLSFSYYFKHQIKKITKRGSNKWSPKVEVIYSSEPYSPIKKEYNCPNCGKLIENPGRKRKKICPHCSNEYVLVYFREKNLKKLFTKVEGEQHLNQQERELKKRNSERWPELTRNLLIYAKDRNWMKYSFCHLDMAEILLTEGRDKDALRHLLSKCYLDLNGPCDLDGLSLKEAAELGMTPFDLKQGMLIPGTIRHINKIIDSLNLSEDEVRKIFFDHNLAKNLKLPKNINACWDELRNSIF